MSYMMGNIKTMKIEVITNVSSKCEWRGYIFRIYLVLWHIFLLWTIIPIY